LFYQGVFKKGNQMRRVWGIFLAMALLLNVCGCVPLLIGAVAGGVTVYAVSKDTVQGDTDRDYEDLWSSALNVAASQGVIKQESKAGGYIYAEGNSGRVWIKMVRLTRIATRMRVSCRKMHLPNLALAQDIFTKILEGGG
jgi:hypothetical protein